MNLRALFVGSVIALLILAVVAQNLASQQAPTQRKFTPEDLFRIRQIGEIAWTPDGQHAIIELTKPNHTLGSGISNEIALLDVQSRTLRSLTANTTSLGLFHPQWSPDGHRLAFLSVDGDASIRAWIWTMGTDAPSLVPGLDIQAGYFEDEAMAWVNKDNIAFLAWDIRAQKKGNIYTEVLRGPNAAREWERARHGRAASVSVLESGHHTEPEEPSARLVVIDVRTNTARVLARGRMHNLRASSDGRFLKFDQEEPGIPGQAASSYFALAGSDVDAAYVAVNQGTTTRVIDQISGAEVAASFMPDVVSKPSQKEEPSLDPPRPDAAWLSSAPVGVAALYASNASDGSRLWLCGSGAYPKPACTEIWHANQWIRQIKTGSIESIPYQGADGSALTAWLLLPPDYSPGVKLPVVTIVYPGLVYEASKPPGDFSLYEASFWEHPQLFAALGYAVLLPSMPPAKNQAEKLKSLGDGVLPAVDAVIERGVADPDRIAVAGQSDGGFATLGLITQTNRFRSAIESAGCSDLVSLYGTFYGQYRHGDSGRPEKGQVLRMLQMEKGLDGLGGPPWAQGDLYRAGSALFGSEKVQTPLMLIHGDLDFIPIQQDEEFFTALLRQDKRAYFVRYAGEGHTISNRADVLDLWTRVADWLTETMPPPN